MLKIRWKWSFDKLSDFSLKWVIWMSHFLNRLSESTSPSSRKSPKERKSIRSILLLECFQSRVYFIGQFTRVTRFSTRDECRGTKKLGNRLYKLHRKCHGTIDSNFYVTLIIYWHIVTKWLDQFLNSIGPFWLVGYIMKPLRRKIRY